MREYINIIETENANIRFEDMGDKVIAQLKSYNSAIYTRLANRVIEITKLEAEIKAAKEEIKSIARVHVADLFAAEDSVKTRVVDTVSFILTLSKDPKPTETYQYAKIVEALSKELTPELILVLNDLKEKFKTITQKEPSLKIQHKDELTESIQDTLKVYFSKFLKFINNWARNYDSRLEELKNMAAV